MARVLLVGKGPPERGGIAAFLTTAMTGPVSSRHELRLLNLTRADEVPEGGRLTSANLRRTMQDVVGVLRGAADADVVHIHSALAPTVTLVRAAVLVVAARLRGAGVIVHAHGGLLESWLHGWARRLLTRFALRPADLVVAVSTGGHAALGQVVDGDRLVLLANGVDTERFHPGQRTGNGPPRVLYVGILTPRKGVIDLLDASTRLRAEGVDHEVWLAGGMPDEGPEAERQVRDAAGPEVRFLGSRPHDEMPEIYREVDVFCLPSWWEASPLSVLEAMASGLPVVATAVGDVPHMVQDGTTGRVVPPRDPARLAEALRGVIEGGADHFGAAGREAAGREFSVARVHDRLGELYDRVADRQGRR